ncbi:hypothetical protein [Streptomyces sp. NPDC048659]|uniref:hypothetical protein n=1 Tax=Streptomyces sp. NPDC048659 TaxID=3155489 RepID=UPI003428C84C
MKFTSKRTIAAVAMLSVLMTGGVTAQAAFADAGHGASAPGKARLKETMRQTTEYSNEDLLQLLLAAQGPIADTHPDLKRMLGFNPDKPRTDTEALDTVIAGYLAARPGFRQEVAAPLHSGDPVRVDAALRDFSLSFNKWLKETAQPAPDGGAPAVAQARGWFWMGAYVAIYANAVGAANAVAYTNAGVATNALATLVVVTWYLEDGSPTGSGIERDAFVDALTSALT